MTTNRHGIFVDAGYLLAGAGAALLGSHERSELRVDYPSLIQWIIQRAGNQLEGTLLRLYWYDAAPQMLPSAEHLLIAEQSDVKLRLGYLTANGQKGVDALIFSDMTELSDRDAVDELALIAGDGDHVPAVERCQALGSRVQVWGLNTPDDTVSPEIRRSADRYIALDVEPLRPFFTRAMGAPVVRPTWLDSASSARPPAGLRTYVSLDPEDAHSSGRRFAARWVDAATAPQVDDVRTSERPSIPSWVDGRLLRYVIEDLHLPGGSELSYEARVAIRSGFWEGFDEATS